MWRTPMHSLRRVPFVGLVLHKTPLHVQHRSVCNHGARSSRRSTHVRGGATRMIHTPRSSPMCTSSGAPVVVSQGAVSRVRCITSTACTSACAYYSHAANHSRHTAGGEADNDTTGEEGEATTASHHAQGESCIAQEPYPIVQLPARSLWQAQQPLAPHLICTEEVHEMIQRVHRARHHFQYPSLCAPQIGWNVHVFTLFDNSVYINARNLDAECWAAEAEQRGLSTTEYEEVKLSQLRQAGATGFAWEPCASCCFLLHYIERPRTVRVAAYNAKGEWVQQTLTGMRARMALHELDHMQGVLFTRRVVDTDHAVPIAGFNEMSRWSDDFPSLEARSTFLYTVFTPPYHFVTEAIEDANLLDRHFEDGIYPGSVRDRAEAVVTRAETHAAQQRWRDEKQREASEEGQITMAEAKQDMAEGKQGNEEDEENEDSEGVQANDDAKCTKA